MCSTSKKQEVLGEWKKLPAFYINIYIILHSLINSYDKVILS